LSWLMRPILMPKLKFHFCNYLFGICCTNYIINSNITYISIIVNYIIMLIHWQAAQFSNEMKQMVPVGNGDI